MFDDLIIACHDGARAQLAASRVVRGAEHRAQLAGSAGQHRAFALEIGTLSRAGGNTPVDRGSPGEAVRAAVHWLDAIVVGENDGDIYKSCARIEARAERLYEKASRRDMPKASAEIIARHLTAISAGSAQLRFRSMGG